MLKEFKTFAMRGNVLDLAVGIIIGAAFGKVVTSFVNDVLMPPLGAVIGNVDFSNFFIDLTGARHVSLAEAKASGAATLNYGLFINNVIDFLIVAFVVFLLVRQVNRYNAPAAPQTQECPFCTSTISLRATRCPNCTSSLKSLSK